MKYLLQNLIKKEDTFLKTHFNSHEIISEITQRTQREKRKQHKIIIHPERIKEFRRNGKKMYEIP